MLWLDLHGDKIRGVAASLVVVIVAAMICAGILVSMRYVLCPAPSGTAVYKMDRITGKVWALIGDQIKVLEERWESPVAPPPAAGETAWVNGKAQLIQWAKEAVQFDSLCEPMLAGTLYDMNLMGWEVYRFEDGELVPCPEALALDKPTNKWVVGYTLRINHPERGKLEYGWYWEAWPEDSLLVVINGNPQLESSYGLEDRTDPTVFALLGPSPEAEELPGPQLDEEERAELFPYVAHEGRANFHRRSCPWAKKIPPEELVEFRTIKEAKDSGRRPCAVCRPR